jgi:hypothetical protein
MGSNCNICSAQFASSFAQLDDVETQSKSAPKIRTAKKILIMNTIIPILAKFYRRFLNKIVHANYVRPGT